MRSSDRFRIIGKSKVTRFTVNIELDAQSEAEARDKAELQDIEVTLVERLTPVPASLARGAGDSRTQGVHDAPIAAHPHAIDRVRAGNTVDPIGPPRRWMSFIPVAIWWLTFVSALLAAISQWSSQFRPRHLALGVLLDARDWREVFIGLEATVASNMYGVAAAAVGIVIFYLVNQTRGRVFIGLSVVTIVINLVGQYRGIGEHRREYKIVVPPASDRAGSQ